MKYLSDYKNLKVLVTGSTGFKGSWLSHWLLKLNAKVYGIGLKPEKDSILFKSLNLEKKINQYYLDIIDFQNLDKIIKKIKPDIIFHLAAQSIVSLSFLEPRKTILTNVIGSTNVLESVKRNKIKNLVYITSDKCYDNDGRSHSYKENDTLGGKDPYSASKAGAELVFKSYFKSFHSNYKLCYATTRAGNVIGGGDMKKDRIIPDIIRSIIKEKKLVIRNPYSTRPWQHVLEPLSGYLKLGSCLINRKLSSQLEPHWNFGPKKINCKSVKEVVEALISKWGSNKKYSIKKNKVFKEAQLLMLDSSKAKKEIKWSPKLSFSQTIAMTVDWYKGFYLKKDLIKITNEQIETYTNK
jgi:CDP-glucose 4,6-dehydratase